MGLVFFFDSIYFHIHWVTVKTGSVVAVLESAQGSESEVWVPTPFPPCSGHDLGQVTSPLLACFFPYEAGVKALFTAGLPGGWLGIKRASDRKENLLLL